MTLDEFVKDKKFSKCVDKLPELEEGFRVSQYAKNVEDAIKIEKQLANYPKVVNYKKSVVKQSKNDLIWFYVNVTGF